MKVLNSEMQMTVITLLIGGACQNKIARLTGVYQKALRRLALKIAVDEAATVAADSDGGVVIQKPSPRPPAFRANASVCESYAPLIQVQLADIVSVENKIKYSLRDIIKEHEGGVLQSGALNKILKYSSDVNLAVTF